MKQTFKETFFKKLEYRFLVESIEIENASFHTKLPYQKSMLRQMEWWVQNWLITRNGVLPLTNLFFRKFCFRLRTFTNSWFDAPTTKLPIFVFFCERWSFIWWCLFPESILNVIYGMIFPEIIMCALNDSALGDCLTKSGQNLSVLFCLLNFHILRYILHIMRNYFLH